MISDLFRWIDSALRKTSLFSWCCLAVLIFIVIFVCNVIVIIFSVNKTHLEELFKIFYAVPLLIALSSLASFIFKLRRKDNIEKYRFYFLGFVVLVFTVIYSVSFMGYDIQGVKRAERFAEESKKYKEEAKVIAQENKETSERTQIAAKVVEILGLSEKANWKFNGGDLQSYKNLKLLQSTVKNDELKKIVDEQINIIENAYSSENLWIAADSLSFICQYSEPPCAKGLEPTKGFNAKNVYEHTTDLYKLWPEHARAASLIRNIDTSPNKTDVSMADVNKSLVRLMKNENEKIMVRKIAFETYKYLNDFHPESEDIFDFNPAIEKEEKEEGQSPIN